MTKRVLDALLSSLSLIVLSPLLLAVGFAVFVDSGRPILFRQERVGLRGRRFQIVKFRTMTTDSAGPGLTVGGDERVTRVGGYLRSSKLDELPQLWNVLTGSLSLVGPRPELAEYVELWPAPDRDVILSIRPGITDPASFKYRREAELLALQPDPDEYYRQVVLPDKVRLYRNYVETRSGPGDVQLVMSTLRAVVAR